MSDSTTPAPGNGRRTSRAKHRSSRVRFAPAAILGGVAASAAIALSMSGTLAGFVAQITNNNNSAASGTLTLQETNGTTTCNSNTTTAPQTNPNTVTCAINKFNGSTTIVPGTPVTASVTMKNTGSVNAGTFTLTPGTCGQVLGTVNGGATDACSKFTLTITTGSTTVASGTLASLASTPITLTPLATGASASYTFSLVLPAQASSTIDNTYQGITVNQNLVWQLNS